MLFAELLVDSSESRGLQVYFLFNLYEYLVNYRLRYHLH